VFLISLSSLSVLIYQKDNQKREIKEDLIELSNIQYGLFNVDEWRNILADIIAKKIDELEVEGKNKEQLRDRISSFLHKVIGDFEKRYFEGNKGSIKGFIKNIGASSFDIFGEMKQSIPVFTDQIIGFLDDPRNKENLKSYLKDKLDEYAYNTFSKLDYSSHDAIISKYNFENRSSTISALNIRLSTLQQASNNYKYILVLLAALTAAFILFTKAISKNEFLLLTLTCLLFLILGLTLPMIEIDARVSEIKISLLGEQIQFQDQVLYYKSKSIVEVIRLMVLQGGFDLLLVGLLVFVFSILFPLSKLFSSIYLIFSPSIKSNKLVLFLVNKTGKWSMADVMVVAIFMSYIGFSGILTEQLNQIEGLSSNINVLTTNKSSLQTGFFAFTAFAMLSLLTNNKLKGLVNRKTENKE